MGETKQVNGIICIPLPAMTLGNHVLSTTYTDSTGKYQTENKCFNIKVISAVLNVTNHTTAGKPDCTINLQVGVKNELGQKVSSGKVTVYYESGEEHPQTNPSVIGKEGNVIGEADVVDGVAKVKYLIPSDFRAGEVYLRIIYDDSEEGYNRNSQASAFYVLRNGDLKLDVYHGYDTKNKVFTNPIDQWNNVRLTDPFYCVATLYDDVDKAKIPLRGVDVNIKLNDMTITTDINGGPVQLTDTDGKVSAKTVVNEDYSADTVTISAKSSAKQFVGECNVEKLLHIAKRCKFEIKNGGTNKTKDGVTYDLYLEIIVRDESNKLLKGRPVGVKLNHVSLPHNGDFENPDYNYELQTDENGTVVFAVKNISLTRGQDYPLEITIGGGKHIFENRTEVGNIHWNSDNTVYQITYP